MKFIEIILIIFLLSSCSEAEVKKDNININGEPLVVDEPVEEEVEKEIRYSVNVVDEGVYIYNTSKRGAYQYGPSIMKNDDGSYDAWFSSPGNYSTQWDYITYYHSDDGYDWYGEKVVLWPTSGSKDKCSVCDPGVIYFNGYYYLGYTSTNDVNGGGSNNSAFVARSEYPDGPFEKWNGESWGGDPEPIIEYTGDPKGWGVGELSFVVKDDDLYIYYTYFDLTGGSTRLMKADLVDDWPSTMRYKGIVCYKSLQDSLDIAYDVNLDTFIGVAIEMRMSDSSRIIVYESKDGKNFNSIETTKSNTYDYAHNIGMAKDKNGYIDTNEDIVIGYAFGKEWGRWSAIIQRLSIKTF